MFQLKSPMGKSLEKTMYTLSKKIKKIKTKSRTDFFRVIFTPRESRHRFDFQKCALGNIGFHKNSEKSDYPKFEKRYLLSETQKSVSV